jgi:hypothetical protein
MSARRRAIGGFVAVLACMGAALCVWAADVAPPPWRGLSGTTHQEWSFDSGADPASPSVTENPYGTPIADITPGEFASGWLSQIPGLGTQTGYWDLGGAGAAIVIDIDNRPASLSHKQIWVQVTSFVDITQPPLVDVPGGSLLTQQERLVESVPTGGDWWCDVSRWRIDPSPDHEQVVFTTNPAWGAVIDDIVVDTVAFDCHTPPQDSDGDSDVDLPDFAVFQSCFNGPNQPYAAASLACLCLDADADADVDLDDFAVFQACFNGPNNAPTCP